jgi:3-oxoacyl-[acyl-carrier protein] reductase
MDLGLAGKTAIVTGSGGGIGAGIARLIASEGGNVVVTDIMGDLAAGVARSIADEGGRAVAVAADVTDAQSVADLVAATEKAFGGGPDILVNNAGFTRDMRIAKMSENDWDAVVDVILKGAFLCTKASLPSMVERKWGRVVNISSRAHLGNPGQANYSAAKAGIIGFTKAMALENGRYNITVNAVAPGVVETDAVRNLPHFEKIKDNVERTIAIARMGTVADVADAVVFLASGRAGYITGDVLHVSGGRYG